MNPDQLRRFNNAKEQEDLESLKREQKLSDMRAVLSTQAGLRVMGNILAYCRANEPSMVVQSHALLAYQTGLRDAAGMIANGIREADPRLLAECEIAHVEFEELFEDMVGDDEE